MMRNMLAGVAMAAASVVAQNATLNIWMDDSGTVFLNGNQVYSGRSGTARVQIMQGDNVLGVWVHDAGYEAGFAASIDLNECGTADTLITDAAWKVSAEAPAGWATVGFDASSWLPAGVCARVADNDTVPVQHALFSHGARWLWTPHKVYMRKKFTVEELASWTLAIGGHGFVYRIFVDGTQVAQDTAMQIGTAVFDQHAGHNLSLGEHVIAVEATCVDTVKTAYLQAGFVSGRGATAKRMAVTDSTWKYSFVEVSGWTGLAFDDTGWKNLGLKHEPVLGPFAALPDDRYVWPTNMYFRCQFNVPNAGVRHPLARAVRGSRAVSRVYYTLAGQRLSGEAVRAQSGLVIERLVLADGRIEARAVQAR